jgi:hypothetical protein
MRTAIDGLAALRAALREEGGTVAGLLGDEIDCGENDPELPGLAQRAAAGPRVRARARDYELLLEMILEGSHLHYGPQRVVQTDDRDLALLLGDQLYALGLSRLATLEDIDAIKELADVISLVAQAHADSDPELAEAVWEAGAIAVGWGWSDEHTVAKGLAREGDPAATEALRGVVIRATSPRPDRAS